MVLCALRFVGGGEIEASWPSAGRFPVDAAFFDGGILIHGITQATAWSPGLNRGLSMLRHVRGEAGQKDARSGTRRDRAHQTGYHVILLKALKLPAKYVVAQACQTFTPPNFGGAFFSSPFRKQSYLQCLLSTHYLPTQGNRF